MACRAGPPSLALPPASFSCFLVTNGALSCRSSHQLPAPATCPTGHPHKSLGAKPGQLCGTFGESLCSAYLRSLGGAMVYFKF